MSEDFRKETEGFSYEENASASEASQDAEKAKKYTEQETHLTDSQENASASRRTSDTETTDGCPASGTTYSWVNPKLTGEERKEDNSASYTGQPEQNTYSRTAENGKDAFGTNVQQKGSDGAQNTENRQTAAGCGYSGGQEHHNYQSYHIDTPQPENVRTKKKKDGKVKKPMSLGKKWGMVISMAAVFGIVAGGVFTGTSMLGAQLTGSGTQSTVTIPTTATNTTAAQSSTSSSGMSVKSVASSAMPSLVAISTTTVEEVQTFFGTASQ